MLEIVQEKEPTIHAIVTFLYRTVTAANAIYRSLKFESNGDVLYRFTLRIKRIRVRSHNIKVNSHRSFIGLDPHARRLRT